MSLIAAILARPCAAAAITVDNDGPADYANIQAAIDAAANGDEIVVADGTYTGPGNRDIDFKGKAITVRSENGAANCIIDCQGTASEPHRGFYFGSYENHDSVLEGFTVQNGYGYNGGALITNRGDPVVRDCTFRRNAAERRGGAVYNQLSESPKLVNCVFEENTCGSEGGGIYNTGGCSPELINCHFARNTTQWRGGAMYNDMGCAPTLTNCRFTANSASGEGGGMFSIYAGPAVVNCLFTDNSANQGGAILYWGGGSETFVNCTIANNTAADHGGGVCCSAFGGSATVTNCILWGNRDSSGTGETAQINLGGSVSYSCVQDADADDATVYPGTGNIDDDPRFCDSDFRLGSQSPCVNAGDNSAVPSGVDTDLDGSPRIQGGRVDMGAYESSAVVMAVQIDIKPGTAAPNPINPSSSGVIPVAILTTADFDAADVDWTTVSLAGSRVAVRGKSNWMGHFEDMDADGDEDLVVQVQTQCDGATWTSGEVVLEGETWGGQPIRGRDTIVVVPEQ